MTGLVYFFVSPTGFRSAFLISETIARLSALTPEDLRMSLNAIVELSVNAARFAARVIAFLEGQLPYGHSPLTSLCDSSEKAN
jgi:hypothetical protein